MAGELCHYLQKARDGVLSRLDGRGGQDQDDAGDSDWWAGYVARVQQAADAFRRQ